MDHLGVADELERDQPQSAIDVVVANLVHVTLDRGEDEEIDLTHIGETPRDRVRVGQVEADPAGAAADIVPQPPRLGPGPFPVTTTSRPSSAYDCASSRPSPCVPPTMTTFPVAIRLLASVETACVA